MLDVDAPKTSNDQQPSLPWLFGASAPFRGRRVLLDALSPRTNFSAETRRKSGFLGSFDLTSPHPPASERGFQFEDDVTQQPYCPDRRTALETFALAAGGIAFNLPTPSSGKAKHVRMQRLPIVYELNGGTQQDGQVKYVWRGESLSTSQLKKPKRKGYTFVAWYSDARLTKKAALVFGKVKKSKRTVYAKWRIKRYSITYNLNGGTAQGKLPASYTIESKRIVFKEPTRRGYRFLGWYADSKFTKKKSAIKAGSTGNVKVYARWECIKYTIEYELNGGEETVALPKS